MMSTRTVQIMVYELVIVCLTGFVQAAKVELFGETTEPRFGASERVSLHAEMAI